MIRRRLPLIVLAAALIAAFTAGSASAASEVSSNWSGFTVSGNTFSAVSGSWVQPAATCTTGTTSSAFWVGLGGNSDVSNALEQIGTSSDCSASGAATYSAWYELVPAASVPINLKIYPGNKIWASVKVTGTKVTVQVKNVTRKTSFTKILTMAAPDLSSAEWIAEAPSLCDSFGRCRTVALTNFGTVDFKKALATAGGHIGTISDSLWTAASIELQSVAGFGRFASAYSTAAQAVPTVLSTDGSAFSVGYSAVDQTVPPDPYGGGTF